MKGILRIAALAAFASGACLAGDVYQAASPEPTPEETLILEYMNRFRADPVKEADLILAQVKGQNGRGGWQSRGVDLEMFEKEMKALKPNPPLVFNLQLLDAARKHSYYMIHNGLGHDETAGKTGYTGNSFSDRCKAAGYTRGASGENCYASAPGPLGSHTGFIIDAGAGGTGGMQAGRGHRMNMHSAGNREVGPGAVPSGNRLSVTHNFGGGRGVARFVGGVIYVDKNHNGQYDLDEGRAGVAITGSDGSSTRSWSSGAFTLELKSAGAVTVSASASGKTFAMDFAAGKDNVKFDWIVPQDADIAAADALLAKVDGAGDPSSKPYFNAVVDLYMGASNLCLDPDRAKKVAALTKDVGKDLAAAQEAVLAALKNYEAQGYMKVLNEKKQPYGSSAAASWFKEADIIGRTKGSVIVFEQQSQAGVVRSHTARAFLKSLEDTEKQLTESAFKGELAALVARAKEQDPDKPKTPQGGPNGGQGGRGRR